MRIASAKIFAYRLPLARPLVLKRGVLEEREGLLLKLVSDSGCIGWGEAAPLPGFSQESLAVATKELCTTREELAGAAIPEGVEQLEGRFEEWLSRYDLAPSSRFALESAVLGLVANELRTSVALLTSKKARQTVSVNGLITEDDPPIEAARKFVSSGYRTVKMKVGRWSLDEDVAVTCNVARELPDGVTLRLDANRAWSFEQAGRFLKAISGCEPEYIEEPLSDPSRLSELVRDSGVRIALDESLVEMVPEQLSGCGYASAVILKPTLLGGLERAAEFARRARRMGLAVVVSSSFESSIGIAILAQFAAAYGSIETPTGLDTLSWFKKDLLQKPVEHSGGRLNIAQVAQASRSVIESVLTGVPDG